MGSAARREPRRWPAGTPRERVRATRRPPRPGRPTLPPRTPMVATGGGWPTSTPSTPNTWPPAPRGSLTSTDAANPTTYSPRHRRRKCSATRTSAACRPCCETTRTAPRNCPAAGYAAAGTGTQYGHTPTAARYGAPLVSQLAPVLASRIRTPTIRAPTPLSPSSPSTRASLPRDWAPSWPPPRHRRTQRPEARQRRPRRAARERRSCGSPRIRRKVCHPV